MTPLCDTTKKMIEKLFPAAERDAASSIIAAECGTNLPLMGEGARRDELLRRIRTAALKISNGKLDALQKAVQLAKLDWRDLLMEAGFGGDIDAHKYWATQMLLPRKKSR